LKSLLNGLKEKWEIKSNFQFLIINLVFALAGSSIVLLRPLIFRLLGISPEWSFPVKAILYLLTVTPTYFIMLNLIAVLFGQSVFFRKFTGKVLARFYRR
jgi:hypothetical protein